MKNEVEMYREMFGILCEAIYEVSEICTDKKCVEILDNAILNTEDVFIAYHEHDTAYPNGQFHNYPKKLTR